MEWKWAPSAAPAIRTASSSPAFSASRHSCVFISVTLMSKEGYSSISSGKKRGSR